MLINERFFGTGNQFLYFYDEFMMYVCLLLVHKVTTQNVKIEISSDLEPIKFVIKKVNSKCSKLSEKSEIKEISKCYKTKQKLL